MHEVNSNILDFLCMSEALKWDGMFSKRHVLNVLIRINTRLIYADNRWKYKSIKGLPSSSRYKLFSKALQIGKSVTQYKYIILYYITHVRIPLLHWSIQVLWSSFVFGCRNRFDPSQRSLSLEVLLENLSVYFSLLDVVEVWLLFWQLSEIYYCSFQRDFVYDGQWHPNSLEIAL